MIAALKSLTNNSITNSIWSFGSNLYNDPSSQLESMMKYTSIFNKATLEPIVLVGSSIMFLISAKKANTKTQKAIGVIGAIATGIMGGISAYTLYNAPTSTENEFVSQEEICTRLAVEAFQNCVK